METPKVFNGTYTVESPKGGHRTFRIATVQNGKLKNKRIVSLLQGPDNTRDYFGFAFVDDYGVRVWGKFSNHANPSEYDKYATVLWSLATEGEQSRYWQMGYRLLVSKFCLRCNRQLTTPESIARGLGPECAGMGGH